MKRNELVKRCIQNGYTLRANINPGFVLAIGRWAKDKGNEVAGLIQAGETKNAIKKLVEAQNLKNSMRKAAFEKTDLVVSDKNGNAIFHYYADTEELWKVKA